AWNDGNSRYSEFSGEIASAHNKLRNGYDTFYAFDRKTLSLGIQQTCNTKTRVIYVQAKNGKLTITEDKTIIVDGLGVTEYRFSDSLYILKSSTKGIWIECGRENKNGVESCYQYNLERKNTPALVKATTVAEASELLAKGADINSHDIEWCTALHSIAESDNIELASFLLKHGAKVDITDAEGRTPLATAAFRGNTKSAQFFLEHGASVDGVSKDSPPLISAALSGKVEIVKLLLDWKADPNIRANPNKYKWNDKGQTALDIVKEMGKQFSPGTNPEFEAKTKYLIELLVKAGAKQ
ncbi:MAG: ankyrin repeat domain-containing protein, partial [Proteobacteria bacterium]|nr:ankyrin repeat domain-containing protein [Pseudomonadota bacterium]